MEKLDLGFSLMSKTSNENILIKTDLIKNAETAVMKHVTRIWKKVLKVSSLTFLTRIPL